MTSVKERREQVQQQIAELHEKKSANDLEMANIKVQLEAARFQARATGVYSDPKWYARAQYALRARGREAQRIQVQIGEMGRLLRKLNAAQLDQCFVESARKLLDQDVFSNVWNQARKLSTERAGGDADDTEEASGFSSGTERDGVRMVQVTRSRPTDSRGT